MGGGALTSSRTWPPDLSPPRSHHGFGRILRVQRQGKGGGPGGGDGGRGRETRRHEGGGRGEKERQGGVEAAGRLGRLDILGL